MSFRCTISRKYIILIAVFTTAGCLTGFFCVLYYKSKTYRNGAIIASRKECAQIGGDILDMKGTFVDAAIAMLFCESIHHPQKLGLGGGFLATIYIKSKANAEALIAKEVIPEEFAKEIFSNESSSEVGLSIAVPGELKGYYALHRKYGKLKWAALVRPTIKICETGHLVDEELAKDLKSMEPEILRISSFREIFVNKSTGKVYTKGSRIHCLQLTETLKLIAEEGANAIYNGGLIGKLLVEDIRSFGGKITENDLNLYEHKWSEPIKILFNNYTVYTVPLLGSGVILTLILSIIEAKNFTSKTIELSKIGMKFGEDYFNILPAIDEKIIENIFIKLYREINSTKMPDLIKTHIVDTRSKNVIELYSKMQLNNICRYSGANVVVLTPNGNVIAVTSTINSIFGAMRRSSQTGIILSDSLKNMLSPNLLRSYGIRSKGDFSNMIIQKYGFSFMCPLLIIDRNGYPRIVLSAGGDLDMIVATLKIILKDLKIKKKSKYK